MRITLFFFLNYFSSLFQSFVVFSICIYPQNTLFSLTEYIILIISLLIYYCYICICIILFTILNFQLLFIFLHHDILIKKFFFFYNLSIHVKYHPYYLLINWYNEIILYIIKFSLWINFYFLFYKVMGFQLNLLLFENFHLSKKPWGVFVSSLFFVLKKIETFLK